jgi:hypothetical protein
MREKGFLDRVDRKWQWRGANRGEEWQFMASSHFACESAITLHQLDKMLMISVLGKCARRPLKKCPNHLFKLVYLA